MKRYFLFSVFILCAVSCAESLENHAKLWTAMPVYGPMTENKKWNYYLEPQLRFIDDAYKFNQANLYFGLYYQTIPQLSVWFGGYRQYAIRTDGSTYQEYRLWEQATWNIIQSHKIKFSSRNRFEQRKDFSRTPIANRFRERLELKLLLNEKKYFLVLSDEGFFQLNQPSWVTNKVFAENRAYIGVEIPVNHRVSYQVGYLNQYVFAHPNQMNNILYLNLTFQAD